MVRFAGLISVVSVLAVDPATADEVRHTTFPGPLLGAWGQSADNCAKGDKTNFSITTSDYTGPDGSCTLDVVVETPGPKGPNYSVRGRCKATAQDQPHVVSVIMRPDGPNQISAGTSFTDLKPYQRCPAK
jgi:hypothetical protein